MRSNKLWRYRGARLLEARIARLVIVHSELPAYMTVYVIRLSIMAGLMLGNKQ